MKKIFMLLIAMLLIFSSCSGNTATPPSNTNGPKNADVTVTPSPSSSTKTSYNASDFYPADKDVHLIYKGYGSEYAGFDVYTEYVKNSNVQLHISNGGTSTVYVYNLYNGAFKEVYRNSEIYYHYDFTSSTNEDTVLIKDPIKTGNSWTLKDGSKRTITSTSAKITTPSGTYNAIEITTTSQGSVTKEYYAENIGLIKRIVTPRGSNTSIVSELEKIENGAPFTQTIRFYFPEFSKDRIVYMDRKVDIKTNEDMKYKFQKELKTIPQNSSLSKVLTANVQVLGSTVDMKKGIVTVNFSHELVSDMNAGSGLESMVLKSIVNTFGRYYQVGKVIITIDGKPYSSGHIKLKPGEYFTVDDKNTAEYK